MKPLLRYVTIPPLIGMIFLGFIARNFFGGVMEAYPNKWAAYIRVICLCTLMLRGGINVKLREVGITVGLLSIIPMAVEGVVVSLIAMGLFNLPVNVTFNVGFSLSCISPSILIPCLLFLISKNYGVAKGIPSTLIPAGTFDDILCVVM